jgi:hypothetical protein
MQVVVRLDGVEIFGWRDPAEVSISHGLLNAIRSYRAELIEMVRMIDDSIPPAQIEDIPLPESRVASDRQGL